MKTCATPLSRRPWKSSLALGAVALGSQGAHGAVIYNDFADVVLSGAFPANWGSVKFNPGTLAITAANGFDLSSVNIVHFQASTYDSKYGWTGTSVNAALGFNNVAAAGAALGAGVLVDSSIAGGFTRHVYPLGTNLSNVFAGVRIDAGGGNINYGWIRYTTGPDSGTGQGPGTITIYDAAFESTVGQGITTPGGVPEPSRALLLALAGGAMALRRRRALKQAA